MSVINNTLVRVVPWNNAAEFRQVYEYLYSDEINKKKWAYDTISVWETRCHPSLPAPIEATYALTSAVIQDILWTNKASLNHHSDLQAIYGTGITRFVSLIVEVNKNKYPPTCSNTEVAKSIGVPSFIVDIRNELCHFGRPSLSQLRLAAQSSLSYLRDTYWEKEATQVNDLVKQPVDDANLRALFKDFIQFHDDKKAKGFKSEDDTKFKANPEYTEIMFQLDKYLKKNKRLFVKVLVSDGIFIPTDEDFQKVSSKEDYELYNNDYLDNEDDEEEAMDCDLFEAKNFPDIIEYHETLWAPIIALLNKYDAVPFFMETLLRSQGSRTLIGQKLLVAWILKILRIHSPNSESVKKSQFLKRIFRYKGIMPKVSWLRMLHAAVVNPCKHTLVILPLIFNNCKIKGSAVHRIVGIIAIKLGLVNTENQETNFYKLFHTVEDLKKALAYQRRGLERQPTESIASPCPDDCHKSWPIGSVINPIKDSDDIEEEMRSIFDSCPEGAAFVETRNENEDEDMEADEGDEDEGPNLTKFMRELKKRRTLLYE